MLKVIKETLRQVPEYGLSYGLWQFNQPNPSANSHAELRFNYLGQLGGAAQKAAFELLPQLEVPLRDPASTRSHVLDVDGRIAITYMSQPRLPSLPSALWRHYAIYCKAIAQLAPRMFHPISRWQTLISRH